MLEIPGLNIQYPWSKFILDGLKTIETRNYECPKKFLNVPILLIETKRINGEGAKGVGIIVIKSSDKYQSLEAYNQDFHEHMVEENSAYFWNDPSKPKFRWIIDLAVPLLAELEVKKNRGYVWTSPILIPDGSFPKQLLQKFLANKQS